MYGLFRYLIKQASLTFTFLSLSLVLFATTQSHATNFIVQVEDDVDAPAGAEVLYITYDTFADLMIHNLSSNFTSPIDLNPAVSTTGLAYDGTQYIVQVEDDVDAPAGAEVLYITYDTFADLMIHNPSSNFTSPIDLNPAVSTTGLAYDGTQYIVQVEDDVDAPAGAEVLYITYDTFADLMIHNPSSNFTSPIDLNPAVSTTGLAYDGTQYIVQVEDDVDAPAGAEVLYITYDTFADLMIHNPSGNFTSPIDLNPAVSTTGLAFDGKTISGDPIPEPSTILLFGTGLAGLGWWRYRKQKTA